MKSRSEVAVGLRKSPEEALRVALSKLNEPIVTPKNIRHVVIKPSIYDPNLPGNTDANMVQSVIRIFGSLGPVSVVESDNPLRTTQDAFLRCGYNELTGENIELLNLSDNNTISVTFSGHFFKNRRMPRILHEEIFLINVATLKAEPEICTIGAGIKNLFGLLPEPNKSDYHKYINQVLMDLLEMYRPNLSVIDLTNVVIGKREDRNIKKVGGVVVGVDPVAVDSFCSSLFGIDPMEINHLKIAHALGFGEALLDRIAVRGTKYQIEQLNQVFNK